MYHWFELAMGDGHQRNRTRQRLGVHKGNFRVLGFSALEQGYAEAGRDQLTAGVVVIRAQ